MSNPNMQQASRRAWTSNDTVDHLRLGAQLRTAEALERIASVLECHNAVGMAKAIIRMDKRLARRTPLGGKKR